VSLVRSQLIPQNLKAHFLSEMGFFCAFRHIFAFLSSKSLIERFSDLTGLIVELAKNVVCMLCAGILMAAKKFYYGKCKRGHHPSRQKNGWHLECKNSGNPQKKN
jgi:membrane-bound acyltransferase YfiQ involved in biofilm formation